MVGIMSLIGTTICIRGEIASTEDLVLDGQIDGGPVWNEQNVVTVAESAVINADLIARRITVLGKVTGMLLASEGVDVRETAKVEGRIVASILRLEDGASFSGTVEPQHFDAALRVAKHRRAS
jgi:cytoskeletal protein CcmA (bactofilin family)